MSHDCRQTLKWNSKLRAYVCTICGAEDRETVNDKPVPFLSRTKLPNGATFTVCKPAESE